MTLRFFLFFNFTFSIFQFVLIFFKELKMKRSLDSSPVVHNSAVVSSSAISPSDKKRGADASQSSATVELNNRESAWLYVGGPDLSVYTINIDILREKAPNTYIVKCLRSSSFGVSQSEPLFLSVPSWYLRAISDFSQVISSSLVSFAPVETCVVADVLTKLGWTPFGDLPLASQPLKELLCPRELRKYERPSYIPTQTPVKQFYEFWCDLRSRDIYDKLFVEKVDFLAVSRLFEAHSMYAEEFVKIVPDLKRFQPNQGVIVQIGVGSVKVVCKHFDETTLSLDLVLSAVKKSE